MEMKAFRRVLCRFQRREGDFPQTSTVRVQTLVVYCSRGESINCRNGQRMTGNINKQQGRHCTLPATKYSLLVVAQRNSLTFPFIITYFVLIYIKRR